MELMTYLDALALFVAVCGVIILGFLLVLKVWDAIRAWRYNRKQASLRELNEAFADGYSAAMGDYAKVQTCRVVLATPDRPAPERPKPDPWMGMVKADIEEIFEDLDEAAHG